MNTQARKIVAAFAAAGACAVGTVPAQVAAQAYPNAPIKFVLPFPPGSGSDLVMRPLAEHMSKTLGQNVVPDNRPGGGSMVASLYVKQQPADGYTIYQLSNTAVVRSVVPNAQIDVRKDFSPIILALYSPLIITVNAEQTKAATVRDFLAEVRARPGALNYGSYGVGSGGHLFMEILLNEAKARMVHVPFQGTAQAVAANVAGDVHATTSIVGSLRPHVKELGGSGKLRVLAVTTADRDALFASAPGMKESGFPDIDYSIWGGIAGPAGMRREVVDRLNKALEAALKDAKVVETVQRAGQAPRGGTPEFLADHMNREFNAYVKLIKETGLKLE